MWKFAELRQKALRELTPIKISDPIEKVILGRNYKVEEWVLDAYVALVKRDAALSLKEGRILGYDTAFKLCEIRDESFRRALAVRGHDGTLTVDDLEERIIDMARRELNPNNITSE